MKYIDAATAAEKISDELNIPLSDLCDIFAEIPSEEVLPTIRRTGSYGRKNEYDEKEVKDIITQEAAC